MTDAVAGFALTNFDAAAFIRDHWQRTPHLIRNPWQAWANPLDPDDLAGLACEPEVESRLIVQNADRWAVEHGPFEAERFARRVSAPWTLLVQSVDHHVPEVAELIEPFRFIPDWRIDDVMVSYAVDGGGVGAHFDQYDVFLVQGLGRRRWQVGGMCDETTALLPHDDLRLLAEFEPVAEWVLEPGDVLYVPPGIAHKGTAVGSDCMTYSIGFRAPSCSELIEGWTDQVLDGLTDDDRYRDQVPFDQANPGEITPAALARLRAMVVERLSDEQGFARWFGSHATAMKNPQIDWRPDEAVGVDEVREAIAGGATIVRNPASRFAFVRTGDDTVTLFVDGQACDCDGVTSAFAEALCAEREFAVLPRHAACAEVIALVMRLVNDGSVALGDTAD